MSIEKTFYKLQLSTDMRMQLYMKLSSFIKQGSPLFDTICKLQEKYGEAKKGDIRSKILGYWADDMRVGKTFSEAISEWVPPAESMLIKSGEKSGNLEEAINNAVEVTMASKRMKSAIIGSMSYPVVLLTILFGMIYLFSTQVVPKLSDIKDPSTWPGPAQAMYKMSVFVEAYWSLCIAVVIGLIVLINFSIPRLTGPVRNKIDGIPPWSIYRSFQSSVFLISISALMKTGTALADAMEELRKEASPYVRTHIGSMLTRMNAGKGNGESMNAGFLPKEVGIDVEIYDETSDFQSAMEQVGRQSIESGIENITAAAKSLGSLVLMGVGVYIGWVYYSFFTLTSSIAQ